MKRRRCIRALLLLGAFLVLGLIAVRAFVGDIYPVAHDSMMPTLREGEHVVVLFGVSHLERFDLVVARDEAGQPIVKRVAGLPGEKFTVSPTGDLWIDGRPLPPHDARPPLIPVFDSRLHSIEDHFRHGATDCDPWIPGPDYWELDAREIFGRDAGLLALPHVRDGYIDGDGQRVPGTRDVGDIAMECEVLPLEPGGFLRFELTEEKDTFVARVDLSDWPRAVVQLSRHTGRAPTILDEVEHTYTAGVWLSFSFANIDDHLTLRLGDLLVESPAGDNELLASSRQLGERVKLGGEGCRARFRALRVARDLHYTQRDSYGVGTLLDLGPDEVFLLGDNSAVSRDSRAFGPVRRDRILGRVIRVAWPMDQARTLAGR